MVASRKAVLSRERLLREQAALAVLRRQQAQTAQELSRLETLGTTQWVATEPDAKQMMGPGPACNVPTAVDAEHALIVIHEVTAEATRSDAGRPLPHYVQDEFEAYLKCGPLEHVA